MKKTAWFLLDNRMGSVGQAKGVMQSLDESKFDIVEKKIEYTRLAALPNCLRGATLLGLTKDSKASLYGDFPDLVVSSSRRTAPIARWLKKKSGGKTKIVQLMHPGNSGLKDFDLIFVPDHDRETKKSLPNMVYLTGCPHRVNEKNLSLAHEKWQETFAELPRPLTAVIIGGAIKGKPFSSENARALGREIRAIKQKIGGSILITDSRRTGSDAEKLIKEEIEGIPAYTYWWGENKENPIMGFWACADNILVTGDSVSMPCECCGSGKPVFIFTGKNWLTPKHHRFVDSLVFGDYAAVTDSPDYLEFRPKQRLNPSDAVAEEIEKLFF